MRNIVSDAAVMSALRRSVAAVLGVEPSLQYRLGRSGGSRPSAPPATPAPAAAPTREVVTEAAPAPAGVPVAVAPAGDAAATLTGEVDHTELEAQVIAELGAEVLEDVTPDE